MEYKEIIELLSQVIEFVGVSIILVGILIATFNFAYQWFKKHTIIHEYHTYRQNIGRSILLGLEFLVAGDIIHSIAVPPSLTSVFILGLIVLIRSFLAIELEMEIEGRWPWQRNPKGAKA